MIALPYGFPGIAPRNGREVATLLVLAAAYVLMTLPVLPLPATVGYAVPLWPAAGLALAVLSVWGWRMWPGVWIGRVCR